MQRLIDLWTGLEQNVLTTPLTRTGVSSTAFEPWENIFNIHCDKY